MRLFGYEINREQPLAPSIVTPVRDDGAINVAAQAQYASSYVDFDQTTRSERDLITRYREIALHPELNSAIDDIVNEMIVPQYGQPFVSINLDKVALDPQFKQAIVDEFDNVLKLMDFNKSAYELLRRWYVDGRLYFQPIIDEENPELGIIELRYLDPRKIKLIREIADTKDDEGRSIKVVVREYFLYDESADTRGSYGTSTPYASNQLTKPVEISRDAIVFCTSGLVDEQGKMILSHIHQAIKPLNQLRMLEDSMIIYRLARAPERRIFYVNVGNMPHQKAEQHLYNMMIRHKNRLVYNAVDGTIRDDRKMQTMIEDYWFPRYGDNRSTEVQTLPAGQNLGEMEDIKYFRDRLFRSLNVPLSRMDPNTPYVLGRASEISRDEIKFQKFIERLRMRFSMLFNDTLEKQFALKGIMAPEAWGSIVPHIHYEFAKDNFFAELKQMSLMQEQAMMLQGMAPWIGKFYSQHFIRKQVLHQDDLEIEQIDNENMIEAQRDLEKQVMLNQTMLKMGMMPPQEQEPK